MVSFDIFLRIPNTRNRMHISEEVHTYCTFEAVLFGWIRDLHLVTSRFSTLDFIRVEEQYMASNLPI